MRLTLRTLLAYLDDTLEPLEIKTIGQKVGESETAQELIARIKQVLRRRRITTPPATGPNSFDPNMVAEYLDSELSTEQIAEVEKICLESDVHLAEVASCHQILTLVLGEPAHVPPTAKERMYALVQGREAIPFRKAATANGNAAAPTSADADADEMFLLGLPFYRRGSWLRWALPLAAVLLFAVVGVALYQSIHNVDQPEAKKVAKADNAKPNPADHSTTPAIKDSATAPKDNTKNPPKDNTNTPSNDPSKKPDKPPVKPEENPPQKPKNGGSQPEMKTPANTTPESQPSSKPILPGAGREAAPKTERVEAAVYHTDTVGPPSLLVQRKSDKEDWGRVKPGGRLSTNDQLMSLPGYASEVWLDNGLHLLLRGHVREFTPQLLQKDPRTGELRNEASLMDYLQECALVLHKPNDTDADLTLQRGRLFLSNHSSKQPGTIVVRLRFAKKVWDLTLHPGTEVVVDLLKLRRSGQPITALNLFLLGGKAGLVVEQDNYPNLSVPGMAYFLWNSSDPSHYDREPINNEQLKHATSTLFVKRPIASSQEAGGMERALTTVRKLMTLDESPLVALRQVLGKPGREQPFQHRLAIYCLGAMDEIKELMNILDRSDLVNSPDRMFAIVALRRWLDRGPEQSDKLFDIKQGKGLLTTYMYTRDEGERIIALLHDPTYEQMFNSKKYYEEAAKDLASDRVAIAELARWRLASLAILMFGLKMPRLESFNAALPKAERYLAMQEVTEKINEGLLPPPEHGKASSGGARPAPRR
ncbi:MAG TPA: hypothetical protein VMG10_02355 [Gemmataceae bacterium]|nr:hypothetical protein [Gemmataceae bacterium]